MALLLKPVYNHKERVLYRWFSVSPSKTGRLQQEMRSCKSCEADVVREWESEGRFFKIQWFVIIELPTIRNIQDIIKEF